MLIRFAMISAMVCGIGCAEQDGTQEASLDAATARETTVDDNAAAPAAAAPAGDVQAAAATGRSDACGALACGSGTVTWGVYSLPNVSMSVRDTHCDGRQVGIQLQVEGTGGEHWGGPVHWNPQQNACDKGYYAWHNLSFEASWKIRSINVVVYVKNGSAGPTTYVGNRADNPST